MTQNICCRLMGSCSFYKDICAQYGDQSKSKYIGFRKVDLDCINLNTSHLEDGGLCPIFDDHVYRENVLESKLFSRDKK